MERQESVTSQKSDTKSSEMTEVIDKVAGTDLNSDQPTSDNPNKILVDSNLIASDGESRLLPLLQGILLNKASPYYTETGDQSSGSVAFGNLSSMQDTSSICNNNNNNYGHEFLKIEDSGTESGEDFRLLAAGLKNTAGGGGAEILGEVNNALSRLQSSIKDGKEINMDIDKRHSLLTLISKLRTELLGPEIPVNELPKLEQSSSCSSTQSSATNQPNQKAPILSRQDSNGSRFARRRNKQNRHTVGVSREELADARRLVEAMIIRDALRTLPPLEPEAPPKVMVASPLYSLQKQKSVASIATNAEPAVLLRPSQFVQKNVAEDSHNNTAKPFTAGGGPVNNKAKLFRHCISYEQPIKVNNLNNHINEGPGRRASMDMIDPDNVPKVKFTNGFVKKTPDHVDSSSDDENTEEQRRTTTIPYNKSYHTVQNKIDAFTRQMSQTREVSVEKTKPLKHTESCKYSTKKNRMRRSNTVDLQRTHDIDTDDEMSDHEDHEAVHSDSTSGFRRGTLAPKVPQVRSIVPELKPQKESDEKFLALLKKQEQQKTTVPTWVSPIQKQQQQQQNWVHKFDNLKHAFETGQKPATFPPPKSNNIAMKFWKCAEQGKTVDRSAILPPSGKVKSWQPPQPKIQDMPKPEPPKPLPKTKFPVDVLSQQKKETSVKKTEDVSGKFSHAPTSAFKPPSKKIQVPQEIFNSKEVKQEPKKIAPVSTGVVKQLAAAGYKEAPYVLAPKPMEPTKNVVNSLVRKNSLPKQKEAPLPCHIPWNGRKKDGAVDMAASKLEVNTYQPKLNPKYLPADYVPPFPAVKQAPVPKPHPPAPVTQFKRHNSMPRQIPVPPPETHPLPVNVNTYDPTQDTLPRFNDQFNVDTVPNTPDEKLSEPVYTITDYTPAAVSTYAEPLYPPVVLPPTLSRSDSLTNPEAEPLVLTCTNQVYQPAQMSMPVVLPPTVHSGIYEKHKPMSMSTPSVSSSVMITAEEMSDTDSDDTDDDFSSEGGPVQEFKAVAKVMAAPVSGTAVTVSRKTQDLETENNLAQSLQVSLQNIAKRTPDRDRKLTPNTTVTTTSTSVGSTGTPSNRSSMGSSPYDNLSVHHAISHGGADNYLQVPLPKVEVNSPTTPPMYEYQQPPTLNYKPHVGYCAPKLAPLTAYNNTTSTGYYQQHLPMSRQVQIQAPPHHNSTPYRMNDLQRAKSSHYLSVPETSSQPNTQIKPIMQEKQKQIAAYFGSGPNSAFKPLVRTGPANRTHNSVQFRPQIISTQLPQSSILKKQPVSSVNRAKSSYAKGGHLGGLCRSQTMPNVNDINLLDEGNVEDAFEQLINS